MGSVASKRLALVALLSLLCSGSVTSAAGQWEQWQFLVGAWKGEGGGKPGQAASGGFSFEFDLGKKILVRKNRADYPATKERPAFSHEDLMIAYPEAGAMRAIYFDNEGHVIRYSVEPSSAGKNLVLVSEAAPSAPRYRLIYSLVKEDTVSIKFEIAPPGKPDSFSTYVEALARRVCK